MVACPNCAQIRLRSHWIRQFRNDVISSDCDFLANGSFAAAISPSTVRWAASGLNEVVAAVVAHGRVSPRRSPEAVEDARFCGTERGATAVARGAGLAPRRGVAARCRRRGLSGRAESSGRNWCRLSCRYGAVCVRRGTLSPCRRSGFAVSSICRRSIRILIRVESLWT